MILKEFIYHRPKTAKEAIQLFKPQAKFLAGGTFLLPQYKRNNVSPGELIGLKNIRDLGKIKFEGNKFLIGAMASLDDVSRNERIREKIPFLTQAIKRIATPQIRNMATIGGNICSRLPWADLGYILLALDAELEFSEGKLSISDFFTQRPRATSLLQQIIIARSDIKRQAFYRLSENNQSDIPLCAVCIIERENKAIVTANLGNNFPHKFSSGLDFNTFSTELESVQKDEYRKHMLKVCFNRAREKYEA